MATPSQGTCAQPGDWIAVDWGTTSLRAWLVSADGAVRASVASGPRDRWGMGSLNRHEFEPVLVAAIAPWLGGGSVDVLVCGMAGARQGWREAPYVEAPTGLTELIAKAIHVPVEDRRLVVRILPGICMNEPETGRFDVMRGEETQLAGLMAREGLHDAIVCLPGTHAKWVRIAGGRIESFTTMMTGELHAVLREHSILRHSLDDDWNDEAFDRAVREARTLRGAVLPRLFGIRAADLLASQPPGSAAARLSGLLIGADVAANVEGVPAVEVVASDRLAKLYARAIGMFGLDARIHDGEELAVAGLAAMRVEEGAVASLASGRT